MMVWIPETETIQLHVDRHMAMHGKFKALDASHTYQSDNLVAIADHIIPRSSSDEDIPRWTSWGARKKQWIEITLDEPINMQSLAIYWFDDGKARGFP